MPLIEQIQIGDTVIGFWRADESLAALRAGITLSPLTVQKLSRVHSEHRAIEILATRRLMHRMGIADTNLYYNSNGKPLLKSGRHISISHSSGVVCVAVSDTEVGIDIQSLSFKLKRILKWFVHSLERKDVKNENILRLTLVWAAKEALYKLWGVEGVSLNEFQVKIPDMIAERGEFKGRISTKKHQGIFFLHYGRFEKYVWVLAKQEN